jgi:hypothetical protein
MITRAPSTPDRRAGLAGAVLLFGLLLASPGCENAAEPEGDPPAPRAETGSLAGFLLEGSPATFVSDPAIAPAGSAPAAGGGVRLVRILGGEEFATTTAADGSFGLDDLPPGLYRVEGRIEPAAGEPDAVLMMSVIAGGSARPADAFPVSRDAAFQAVRGGSGDKEPGSYADALILGLMQPLPAGTGIAVPTPPEGVTPVRTTPAAEWFFLVDFLPEARLDHDLEFAFVDAATGEVSRHLVSHTPVVNGRGLWSSDLDYIVYPDLDFADIPAYAAGEPAGPTAEVLQMGVLQADGGEASPARSTSRSLAEIAASSDPQDWFYLGVTLDSRSDFLAEAVDMSAFMAAQGVPADNRRGVLSFSHLDVGSFDAGYRTTYEYLQERMEQRIAQRGRPTLFFFLHGHHGRVDGTPSRMITAKLADGTKIFKKSWFWDLEKFKACKVVLILESCFAHALTQDILARFQGEEASERPELVAFSSSAADEYSFSKMQWQEDWTNGFVVAGGLFKTAFLDKASIVDGDIVGVTSAPGVLVPELATVMDGFVFDQHAQLDLLPSDPAWCEILEDFVTVDRTELVYDSPDRNTAPCARLVGQFVVTSGTDLEVDFRIESSNPVIQTDPRTFTLFDQMSRTVTVLYNCQQPPPVEATLRVIATTSNGYVDTTAVRVAVRPPAAEAVTEFQVRAPGIAQIKKLEVWVPVPAGAEILESSLIDTATGETPPLRPWPQSSATFRIDYEGPKPDDPGFYGLMFTLDDFFGQGCPECPLLTWRYTVRHAE